MEKDINIAKDSRANLIRMKGNVLIQDITCKILLVSDPIIYEGCSWQDVYQYRAKHRKNAAVEAEVTPKHLHARTHSMVNVNPKKNAFLQKVNHPSAVNIVSNIKLFLSSMNSVPITTLIQKDSSLVRKFLDTTEEVIRAHPLWSVCDEQEMIDTIEGLEKYVTLNLHARLVT